MLPMWVEDCGYNSDSVSETPFSRFDNRQMDIMTTHNTNSDKVELNEVEHSLLNSTYLEMQDLFS